MQSSPPRLRLLGCPPVVPHFAQTVERTDHTPLQCVEQSCVAHAIHVVILLAVQTDRSFISAEHDLDIHPAKQECGRRSYIHTPSTGMTEKALLQSSHT